MPASDGGPSAEGGLKELNELARQVNSTLDVEAIM